jgi:hypothetical protein
MYLIFINEKAEILHRLGIAVKMLADDVTVYMKNTTFCDASLLQNAADALDKWAATSGS